MAVATLLAVAYGTRREEAAALGRNPAQLRTPPATVPALPALRRLSLLRQGMACLGALLAQGRWWTRVWLRPRRGPYRPSAVHPSHPEPHMYLSTGRAPVYRAEPDGPPPVPGAHSSV